LVHLSSGYVHQTPSCGSVVSPCFTSTLCTWKVPNWDATMLMYECMDNASKRASKTSTRSLFAWAWVSIWIRLWVVLANIQTISRLSNQLKAQNLDSSTIGTCFNHTSCYDYTTRVNIDFLQSLWNYLQLCYCHPELIHKLTRLKNTKKQNCTIKNRKLTWTSEMHTWSSKHSKTMNLNFLRSLLSYL